MTTVPLYTVSQSESLRRSISEVLSRRQARLASSEVSDVADRLIDGAIIASFVPLCSAPSRAESKLLPFQGRLTDASGAAIDDGAKVVEFDAPTGGNVKSAGEVHKLSVNGGLVNTMLGSKGGLGSVDFSTPVFLQITVDANDDGAITAADPPLLPRQSVVPAIYALVAGQMQYVVPASGGEPARVESKGWEAVFSGGNPITGTFDGTRLAPSSVGTSAIAANSVDGTRIMDGGIGTADLASAAVTRDKIEDGTIQPGDLAQSLQVGIVPPGTIVAFGGENGKVPAGGLLCDGNNLLRAQYSALLEAIGTAWGAPAADQFNLPDLRGSFLRDADDPDRDSRTRLLPGGNSGVLIGSYQPDEFKSHSHVLNGYAYLGGGVANGSFPPGTNFALNRVTTDSVGDAETRPKNAYVNFITKY